MRLLYCRKSKGVSGESRRHLKVEQTSEPPNGPLLPGLNDAIAFVEGDKTKGRIAAGPDVKAIRDWEQRQRSPHAPRRTLLGMVDTDPKAELALIDRAMT